MPSRCRLEEFHLANEKCRIATRIDWCCAHAELSSALRKRLVSPTLAWRDCRCRPWAPERFDSSKQESQGTLAT
jgi:hypothetical protein